MRHRIPDGTIIPAGGYHVLYQAQFGPAEGEADVPPLFTFNSARGDEVYLHQTYGAGALTGYRTGRRFGAAANGILSGASSPAWVRPSPAGSAYVRRDQSN